MNEIRGKNIKSEVLLVIPAYNEAESIEKVVDELTDGFPGLDYVVVLDGPTDGTDDICRRRGYNALYLPVNLGLAGAFGNGMKYARDMGYLYAVQFDGDGQHRPEYIEPMLRKAREGFDIVLGSRFLDKSHVNPDIGFMRGLGSGLIRLSIRLKTGVKITDPTCGLRLYGREIINKFADGGLAPEPDTIASLIRSGAKIAEVPVSVSRRQAGESYLRPLKAAGYMKTTLFNIWTLPNGKK